MQPSSEKSAMRFLKIDNCNIQDLSMRDRRVLRPEGRPEYHLLYILRGACYVGEPGGVTRLEAGHLILYRPHERQEYVFRAVDGSVSGFVSFSGTAADEILGGLGFSRAFFAGADKRLERLFRDMVDEFCLKKPYYTENTAALLLQFMSLAARGAGGDKVMRAARGEGIAEVLRYMHRHYGEAHDVAFYAAMCHLSVGRFAHVFKETVGISPKRYVLELRINAALDLLATTNLSMCEVAASVGIEDVNYFSRLIKRHTGKTPLAQRG
ncbi:MAG: AraC family transcriptional regulator [Ruminococcaceae bacterium]|nr:AraC family transcriptional regulator [Oscillospiraceae bacterium]